MTAVIVEKKANEIAIDIATSTTNGVDSVANAGKILCRIQIEIPLKIRTKIEEMKIFFSFLILRSCLLSGMTITACVIFILLIK
jgi:hypothetical protein